MTPEQVREQGDYVATLKDTDGDPLYAEVWCVDGDLVIIHYTIDAVAGRSEYVFVPVENTTGL